MVRPAVEAWARDLGKLEASRLLCEAGIPAGPSNLAEDLVGDPHVRERDMLLSVPRPDAERPMLLVGNPVKLSDVAEGPETPVPLVGEHTEEVLRAELGLDDSDFEKLRETGAIA